MALNVRIGLCSDRLEIQHDGCDAEDIFPIGSSVQILCQKGEIYIFTGCESGPHFHKSPDGSPMERVISFLRSNKHDYMEELGYPQFLVDNVQLVAEGTGAWKVVLPPIYQMPWNQKPRSLNEEGLTALFVRDMKARLASAKRHGKSFREVIYLRPSWSKGLMTGVAWMELVKGEMEAT